VPELVHSLSPGRRPATKSAFGLALSYLAYSPPMTATQWQYMVKKLDGHWQAEYVEGVLDSLGREGWEAVSLGWMAAGQSGGGDATVLLKRPLDEHRH